MLYEVLVPSSGPERLSHNVVVEAENWLLALREGLSELGLDPQIERRVRCEIHADHSVSVRDPKGGGVFMLRVLARLPEEGWADPPPAEEPVVVVDAEPERPAEDVPRIVARCSSEELDKVIAQLASEPEDVPHAEDVHATLAAELAPIDGFAGDRDRASNLALEVCLRMIPARVGWVLLVDRESGELVVAAARGSRAAHVIDRRVAPGSGLAGHCAAHLVAMAVADVSADPRYELDLAREVGIAAETALCAPIHSEGRVLGVLQLLNRRDGTFDPHDLSVLEVVAERLAAFLWVA